MTTGLRTELGQWQRTQYIEITPAQTRWPRGTADANRESDPWHRADRTEKFFDCQWVSHPRRLEVVQHHDRPTGVEHFANAVGELAGRSFAYHPEDRSER